jgi:hypothetical protein
MNAQQKYLQKLAAESRGSTVTPSLGSCSGGTSIFQLIANHQLLFLFSSSGAQLSQVAT